MGIWYRKDGTREALLLNVLTQDKIDEAAQVTKMEVCFTAWKHGAVPCHVFLTGKGMSYTV